jgi:two-component system sensor kinase FixL
VAHLVDDLEFLCGGGGVAAPDHRDSSGGRGGRDGLGHALGAFGEAFEILEISDREQRRIGQDLHDDLCQTLAGIELMSEVLEEKLSAKSRPESVRAARIAERVQRAIEQTRMLARGLSPLEMESTGLMAALSELASNTEQLFGIRRVFEASSPVMIEDAAAATHLYRIAQEAISNAIKHGKSSEITISLKAEHNRITLAIKDDGAGFSQPGKRPRGMGLRIMKYRAGVIGGSLEVRRAR